MFNKQALLYAVQAEPKERVFLFENDFSLFMVYYFLDYIKYPFASFHHHWFDCFNKLDRGEIKELALIAFRESAKTSMSKIFLIWLICYEKKKYINVDSFDKENAERILFDVVSELQANQKLVADYGQLFNTKRQREEVTVKRISNFVTNNGVRVEAHSTQESIRGRVHGPQRPDFFLFDDIETSKTRDSKAYTKQVADHLTEAIAGVDSGAYSIVYLGNYITEYGNIAELERRSKNNPNFIFSKVPVIEDGATTWPGKYVLTDEEALTTGLVSLEERKRLLGSQAFMAEMMNLPIDESVQEFKKDFWQEAKIEDISHLNYNTYITIDMAVSEKSSADNTGVVINRVTRENKWYITAYKIKTNAKGVIDHLFYLWDLYKPSMIAIEETSFTIAIKPFLDEEMRKRNIFMVIRPLKHNQTQKETRIRGLLPRWENKSMFMIGNCDDLWEEMRVFPVGQHDDVLDALAYQEQIAYPPSQTQSLPQNDVRSVYEDIGL
jgi:phage terminase large subunit-like protein